MPVAGERVYDDLTQSQGDAAVLDACAAKKTSSSVGPEDSELCMYWWATSEPEMFEYISGAASAPRQQARADPCQGGPGEAA